MCSWLQQLVVLGWGRLWGCCMKQKRIRKAPPAPVMDLTATGNAMENADVPVHVAPQSCAIHIATLTH